MVQRLFNIEKWINVGEGQSWSLAGDKVRVIRVEVNAPDRVRLFVIDETDDVRFLATVLGRDTIEFVAASTVRLFVEGGSIDIYSVDGDDPSFTVAAPKIFTKIMERRRRNPELEAIALQMNANMERRLAQQADDLRRLVINRENARAALETARGVPERAGTQQLPDDQPGTSDPPSSGAVGGSNDESQR